jgi:hypothetical protein
MVVSQQRSWLRHYARNRKVAGYNPYELIGLFNWPNYSSRTTALRVTSACSRNEYQEFPGGVKGQPAHKADNLTAIYESTL